MSKKCMKKGVLFELLFEASGKRDGQSNKFIPYPNPYLR